MYFCAELLRYFKKRILWVDPSEIQVPSCSVRLKSQSIDKRWAAGFHSISFQVIPAQGLSKVGVEMQGALLSIIGMCRNLPLNDLQKLRVYGMYMSGLICSFCVMFPVIKVDDDRSDFQISFVFQTGPWWEFDLTREVDNLNSLRFSGDKESSELISERGCAVGR